ncbi:MAG: hypothetical protein IKR86_06425 [Candidatus Methanomethylophilaceae archaeon]|nr:hypothetical protein [Candidatus Methanomethylophilaceae archaeon]
MNRRIIPAAAIVVLMLSACLIGPAYAQYGSSITDSEHATANNDCCVIQFTQYSLSVTNVKYHIAGNSGKATLSPVSCTVLNPASNGISISDDLNSINELRFAATFDKDVVKTVQFQLGTSTQTSDVTSNAASATISGISAGSYNLGVTLELKKQVTASALNSALGMTLTLSAGADHYGSTLYNVSMSPVTFTERGTTAADMIDALSDINDLQEDQNGTYYEGTDGHHYYLVESTDGNDPAIRIDGSEGDNGITDLNSDFSVVLNIPDGVNFCVNLRFSDGWAILGDDNTITVKLTVIEGSSPRTYQTTITDAGNYYIYVKENNNGTKTLVADTTKGYMSGNGNDVAFQASGERGNQFIASNTLEVKLVFQN